MMIKMGYEKFIVNLMLTFGSFDVPKAIGESNPIKKQKIQFDKTANDIPVSGKISASYS